MRNEVNLSELIVENERYVECVAKQYLNQGLTLEQLIEEGNKGLVKAAKRYDPSKGYAFMSYAVWWIRQSILLALAGAEQGLTEERRQQIINRRVLKKNKDHE
ncbi:MAG: sigma-70 family RNA polymerase sigma factor [Bacteroidaceae bacterium]|nr:sigma-70 family RNA polymerase sigma factor [Bacteroidaceae bacterium]